MREAAFTSAVWADMLQAQNPKFVKTGKIRTQLHPHGRSETLKPNLAVGILSR